MSEKPPPVTHLRAVTGAGTPSSAVPRPAPFVPVKDTDTLMRALNEAQGKIMTLENLTRSQEIEIAELRSAKSTLTEQNKRLIESDISVAAKRIIRSQGEEIRAFRTSLRDAHDQSEADHIELEDMKKEYQKLLEAFEERLSAESIVEMLHEQLVIADQEAQEAQTALNNLQSAMSVAQLLHDDLQQFEGRLSPESFMKQPDLFLAEFSRISAVLLENDHPAIRSFGFRMQTFLYELGKDRLSRPY